MSPRQFLFAIILAAPAFTRAEDPATFAVGGLTFTRPADWKWVAVNSPMRKAQLAVPGASTDKNADITFFYFGEGGAGGVEANAKRWLGQFAGKPDAEKIETQEIAEVKVTLVSTEGTFTSGMPGGKAEVVENAALLGAMIENPDGLVFVKMTGPADTVKATRGKFIEFLKTAVTAKK